MIQIWLTYNNGAEKLRLPVPPESFELSTGMNNTVVNIHELGELNLLGKRKLKAITLTSYFPAMDDGVAQYTGFPSPSECIDMIGKWRESGKPIRLLIVGDTLKINEAMAIENFNVSQKHGPQDIYFTLELKEYRFVGRTADQNGATSAVALLAEYTGNSRNVDRTIPDTYVFQAGDDLWSIARRFYGDGSRMSELRTRNGITDEQAIVPGTVLAL
jgi:nucleoid-associated protein YgaU